MKDNTLWIFGDSFSIEFWENNSWSQLLFKSFYSFAIQRLNYFLPYGTGVLLLNFHIEGILLYNTR